MNVTSSTALSGMFAAQSKLNASAHNIANLGTQGFTRQEVVQSTSASGSGTQVSLRSSPAGVGNNLEADLIQQLQSALTYQANVSVLKTNNQVMGTLINIKA